MLTDKGKNCFYEIEFDPGVKLEQASEDVKQGVQGCTFHKLPQILLQNVPKMVGFALSHGHDAILNVISMDVVVFSKSFPMFHLGI